MSSACRGPMVVIPPFGAGSLHREGRGGGPGVGIVARCYVRLVWRWPPGPDRWCPGPLPAHVNPTGGSVGAPPTLPPEGPSCEQKG